MSRHEVYETLGGDRIALSGLDDEERLLVVVLRRKAEDSRDQGQFDDYWMRYVAEVYRPRGLTHKQMQQTKPYQMARDLSERLGIRLGVARAPDYRDRLAELIRTKFVSRKAFCEATGLSEDMLSHVLSRRKHFSIKALEQALGRIGYALHFFPEDGE